MNFIGNLAMTSSQKFLIEVGSKSVEILSKFLSGVFLMLTGAYRTIGTNHLGGCCRFQPSCSEYANEALKIHPVHSATYLIVTRIIKCRPGSTWGFDPVPDVLPKRGAS